MAGAGVRDIKRKIRSVNSTRQITKAMELVSTAKLRRAKERMDITKPYFETVMKTVQDIIKEGGGLRHPYTEAREIKKTLYIVVSADRGLCGGYNINILKTAMADMESPQKTEVIAVGKKAADFFNKHDIEVVDSYLSISEKPEFVDAKAIIRKALGLFADKEIDEIKLVYTRMISTLIQEPTVLTLIPLEVEQFDANMVEDEEDDVKTEDDNVEVVSYEPSAETVLTYVIPRYLESTVYGAMVESSAAQQAARRIAMENASDNADDMISELSLTYNQARQAAITQEISEIVGGAEALK